MSATSDLLFSYLRSIFNATSHDELDISKLEEDYVLLGKGLVYFANSIAQYYEFARSLSRGDLSVEMPPRENELTAPLKSLQSNLKHLTWQSQQVAKGDYKQRIDFMGEFADAFNTMVEQLADRQKKLENEINTSHKHAEALEQGNLLLSELTQYIPEQIFVVSMEDLAVLHTNDLAKVEVDNDPDYIKKLITKLSDLQPFRNNNCFEILFTQGETERYLVINTYQIEWHRKSAVAIVISDISAEKKQLMELENHAYRDALTHVFNRFYGMLTLNEWLNNKKRFSLIFVDLDSLKLVNDRAGHREGDLYLTKVAGCLQSYSHDIVVSRLGGDEYMMLVPNTNPVEAHERMEEIQRVIKNEDFLEENELCRGISYGISYGVVFIEENNTLSASEILSIADERMYEHKRSRKIARQSAV